MSGATADELKEAGNRHFQAQRYNEAIEDYGKAIVKNPNVATYFTNRALAYIHTKQWQRAIDDCRKAAELDSKSVKAFYFLGRALISLEQYDEALRQLTKAHELALKQKVNFGDEVTSQIRLARREKFRREEQKRIEQEIELQSYLNNLIDQDMMRRVKINDDSEDEEAVATQALAEAQNYKNMLNALFAQRREIPDYLCGKISFELLREPVITPSGITYDRADIREHLQRVGHFDPVTRAPLSEDQLIPNLAMKEVVEHFIADNPWALHDCD